MHACLGFSKSQISSSYDVGDEETYILTIINYIFNIHNVKVKQEKILDSRIVTIE